jgi:hypothetical protein
MEHEFYQPPSYALGHRKATDMANLKNPKWTLVQHSAYGYAEKPGWEKAVETRQITTDAELKRVKSAGGFVFASYNEADDQEYKSNYPKGAGETLTYPEVLGTFSDKELDGLRIYIPASITQVIG